MNRVDDIRPSMVVVGLALALAAQAYAQAPAPEPGDGDPGRAAAADFAASMPEGGRFARIHVVETPACWPALPERARRAHAQGSTILGLTVDEQGQVVDARVVRPAGHSPEHRLLDRAALDALVHCPITPGADATGKPATTRIQVTYTWKLE